MAIPDNSTTIVDSLSVAQLAYLAGLIDGEGCILCIKEWQTNKRTYLFRISISFTMCTPEPLTSIAGWLNASVRKYPPVRSNWSERWMLTIRKRVAIPLLKAMLPHLILKREQAELALLLETIRIKHTPNKKLKGTRGKSGGDGMFVRMSQDALDQMQAVHDELRKLKSPKSFSASLGWQARVQKLKIEHGV